MREKQGRDEKDLVLFGRCLLQGDDDAGGIAYREEGLKLPGIVENDCPPTHLSKGIQEK